MQKIGMLVAVEMESVLSKYGTAKEVIDCGGFRVHAYQTDAYTLYVLNSGVGEIAAAAGTQLLISVFGVEMIVNFGVVGGLTDEMAMARTCIVRKAVHYDFDTSQIDPVAPAQYAQYPDVFIPATEDLIEKAIALEPGLVPVICASADKFVGDPLKKAELHKRYGADICEMEAAGILLTCNRSGIPVLLIKTVSDGITGGADEFIKEVRRTSDICLSVADKIIRSL